ncbi:sigma 54-interacting transcriptional regulator [[Clostridium] symbiosum]|uniref:sigma-54 interaction domain-containing protein n=1 Tax=Clostridium symbiosum TaxID=1512 RepID=UPI001D05E9EC|nr:sigma 54-interacting transcriptional regulator [[Clostridium] symbiosum]MCB6607982.1 sigma 54-interacting transcriptional regulator [[Clostridium] symbiosum]MCB6931375.1 sigma 54-interacting transcriptional regulator [[Clostridium] symbiosum]
MNIVSGEGESRELQKSSKTDTDVLTGTILIDKDYRIIYYNDYAKEILSAEDDAISHQSVKRFLGKSFFLPDEPDGEKTFHYEIQGRQVFVTVSRWACGDEKDGPTYLILLLLGAKPSQNEMEEYAKKHVLQDLQEIIEASFDGILVTDAEGNVEIVNQGYVHNTGITREELLGRNILHLVNPVWMKQSVVGMVQEKKETVSLQHMTRNGKSIIVTGTPIFDEQKNIRKIVVNSRDISEIYALSEKLESAKKMEEIYMQRLKQQEERGETADDVVIVNQDMQNVFRLAKKLGNFNTNVLLTGESGVGKDEVAKFIHKNGLRSTKPYVAVNCGAVPENLLESELFGYESGAFTGALKCGKKGLFELADGGVLFLDEVAEIPLSLQVKLLRVLENREIMRLGGTKLLPLNVRIIAATNRDLPAMIKNGSFREDLYYRLNVVNIRIPPLRERKDEIPLFCLKFVHHYNRQYGENKKLTYPVIDEFQKYSWPGNIRELKNVIENMFVLSDGEYLQVKDIPWNCRRQKVQNSYEGVSLEEAVEEVERALLKEAKEKFHTTRQIAEYLKVNQSTVVRKLKKYRL